LLIDSNILSSRYIIWALSGGNYEGDDDGDYGGKGNYGNAKGGGNEEDDYAYGDDDDYGGKGKGKGGKKRMRA
jgi:hypothetical protein